MAVNQKIERLIKAGVHQGMMIDARYGMQQLNRYLEDLSLLEMGVPFSELGISKRRESSNPFLIFAAGTQDEQTLPFSELRTRDGVVAVLRLTGTMRSEDGISSQGVTSFIDNLRMANQSPNVIGAVVEVNSGGGESTAGQMVNAAISDFTKPIIAVAQFMGSAAYMGALNADAILAENEHAEIGSIGSYVTLANGIADWYNRNFTDYYAEQSTQKNIEFRELLKGNTEPLQQMVNDGAQKFMDMVAAKRNLGSNSESTLQGGMFFAQEAFDRGLIDGMGTTYDAARLIVAVNNGSDIQQLLNDDTMKMPNLSSILSGLSLFNNNEAEEAAQEEGTEAAAEEGTQEEADAEEGSDNQEGTDKGAVAEEEEAAEEEEEAAEEEEEGAEDLVEENLTVISENFRALAESIQTLTQAVNRISARQDQFDRDLADARNATRNASRQVLKLQGVTKVDGAESDPGRHTEAERHIAKKVISPGNKTKV